jgi:hypothetical protein
MGKHPLERVDIQHLLDFGEAWIAMSNEARVSMLGLLSTRKVHRDFKVSPGACAEALKVIGYFHSDIRDGCRMFDEAFGRSVLRNGRLPDAKESPAPKAKEIRITTDMVIERCRAEHAKGAGSSVAWDDLDAESRLSMAIETSHIMVEEFWDRGFSVFSAPQGELIHAADPQYLTMRGSRAAWDALFPRKAKEKEAVVAGGLSTEGVTCG